LPTKIRLPGAAPLAAELGPKSIRVHAISPGPLATRAASGIPEFDALLDKAKAKAPARSLVSIDNVSFSCARRSASLISICQGKKPVARTPAAVS
jgi:enoyl-[acyl-carrier-protein] reductase (NADH)